MASKSETFSSIVDPREIKNMNLASETAGHFSGVLHADTFLDKYLPFQDGVEPLRKGLRNSLASILGESETSMYQPFIDAIQPHLTNMDIINTHSYRDASCDYLSPDLSIYPKGSKRSQTHPSFAAMLMFVEFKLSEKMDRFQDPKNYPKKDLPANFSFEHQDVESRRRRGEIRSYVAAISGAQFRTRVISVSVCGNTACFIVWDRAGAFVSEKFDYVKEPEILIGFFYRYSRLTPEQQGIDTTTWEATEEELTDFPDECRKRMKKANSTHQEWCKVMVRDCADAKKAAFMVSYPLNHTTSSPFSRSTRAMLPFDLANKRLVFLKDYWRPDVDTIEKEGDIYLVLEEHNIPHIVPFGMGNDVRNHETSTQKLNNKGVKDMIPTPQQTGLRHYRMTMNVIGKSIYNFKSSHEFVSAIADAMEAHDDTWFKCCILHRDISVGNIIITDEGKGLLIDWDVCIKLPARLPEQAEEATVARSIARTGTWEFMSAKLLLNPKTFQDYCDDRESVLWVLLWVALQYTPTHGRPSIPYHLPVVMKMFNDVNELGDGSASGGRLKRSFLQHYFVEGVLFTDREPLNSLVAELVAVFRVRYDDVPTAEQVKGWETMHVLKDAPGVEEAIKTLPVYKYQQQMDQFNREGWLVEIIREHLGKAGWPKDDRPRRQQTQLLRSTKRKLEQDEDDLVARLSKKNPYGPLNGSRPVASSSRQSTISSRPQSHLYK